MIAILFYAILAVVLLVWAMHWEACNAADLHITKLYTRDFIAITDDALRGKHTWEHTHALADQIERSEDLYWETRR